MKSSDGRFNYFDANGNSVPEGSKPEDVHRFGFQCRSNQKTICSLNLRDRGHDIKDRSWKWDGNFDKPTLEPSVNCKNCWHGFIENGVFVTTNKQPEPKQ